MHESELRPNEGEISTSHQFQLKIEHISSNSLRAPRVVESALELSRAHKSCRECTRVFGSAQELPRTQRVAKSAQELPRGH